MWYVVSRVGRGSTALVGTHHYLLLKLLTTYYLLLVLLTTDYLYYLLLIATDPAPHSGQARLDFMDEDLSRVEHSLELYVQHLMRK